MLSGYTEPAHLNHFDFENQRRTFHKYGEHSVLSTYVGYYIRTYIYIAQHVLWCSDVCITAGPIWLVSVLKGMLNLYFLLEVLYLLSILIDRVYMS